jgi:hypothetical protein
MHALLLAIKDKYRIHVITRVDQRDSHGHLRAKEAIG